MFSALEDTDHEVRARATFYLDEIHRIQNKEEDFLDTKLSAAEVDSIEAFLQVIPTNVLKQYNDYIEKHWRNSKSC